MAATCGDGFLHNGIEECDDGNANDTDACVKGCHKAECGDGLIWEGQEACDDGNLNADDAACKADCTEAYCGDGKVWKGVEDCDDANMDDQDGCTSKCVAEFCGDGKMQKYLGEECDGMDFGGQDCNDFGFDAGTIKCSMNCMVSTDQCIGVCIAPGAESAGPDICLLKQNLISAAVFHL